MKNIFKFVLSTLAIVLATLTINVNVVAAAEEEMYSVELISETGVVFPGDEFTTTVSLVPENAGVARFETRFLYDTDVVELISVEGINDNAMVVINDEKEGIIDFGWVSTEINPRTEKTAIMRATFRAREELSDGDYSYLSIDANVETNVGTDDENMSLVNKLLPMKIYNYGDVTLDHKVNTADTLRAIRCWLGVIELNEQAHRYGDVNNDNVVNSSDALAILRYFVGVRNELGGRYTITFYDAEDNVYVKRSVGAGRDLTHIPTVPSREGYNNGKWSLAKDKYVEPNFAKIDDNIKVYAVYDKAWSDAMKFYEQSLTATYYSEKELYNDLNLISQLFYATGYSANVYWSSTNGAVLNATTGKVVTPTYSTNVTLTAQIVAYSPDGSAPEIKYLNFDYIVGGRIVPVPKSMVQEYLGRFLGIDENGEYHVTYDIDLPKMINNSHISYTKDFEVQVEWSYIGEDGKEVGIKGLNRSTTTQYRDLIATLTFNGKPLEDDGKLYFRHVELTPVTMEDVRYAVINEIALNMGRTVSTGMELLGKGAKYNATIKWISGNIDIASVENNVVTVKQTAVNGTNMPLKAQVTYEVDANDSQATNTKTFELAYTVNVINENQKLVPGVNIDPELYDALKMATGINGDLSTVALRDVTFTYLDLSGYPDIQSLEGLSYCKNLRVLNVSGLKLNSTDMAQISTLNKLQALIARDCDLDSLTDGGNAVMSQMTDLQLLDLSHNNFTNLATVFGESIRYGKLSELYLDNNQLVDITALSAAPALSVLTLSNNRLENEDLNTISGFKFLSYLSLNDNENISDVSALNGLGFLQELRIQNNNVSDITCLRNLKNLRVLYAGNNNIENIYNLRYLYKLQVLYLNDNKIVDATPLSELTKLVSLNVNNNDIHSLNSLQNTTTLVRLYAENNKIGDFTFVSDLKNLKSLALANNAVGEYRLAEQNALSNLTELETLTLSGRNLGSLSFLNNMSKLIRLEVENCGLPAYYITEYATSTGVNGEKIMKVASFTDNVAALLNSSRTLKFLNINNNGFANTTSDLLSYMAIYNPQLDVDTIEFPSALTPMNSLYAMSNLVGLYADNLKWEVPCNGETSDTNLFTMMTELRYISLENCKIGNASWLSRYYNLTYLDLAKNNIDQFDFDTNISSAGKRKLEWLYLDNDVKGTWDESYDSYENVLTDVSLEGMSIRGMEDIPDMAMVERLNLANTGLTSLISYSDVRESDGIITRFGELRDLDISGLQLEIEPVLSIAKLDKLTAVGTGADQIFYKSNVRNLEKLYKKGVDVYLYNTVDKYEPQSQREGAEILGQLPDYSCTVRVAADNVISENNPTLASQVNDFEIVWNVSDDKHYEIVDGKLSVKDYTGIDDDSLTLTASIMVYESQPVATRSFTINTDIVRADENKEFIDYSKANANSVMSRNEEFDYDIAIKEAEVEGFGESVKPVYDKLVYTHTVINEQASQEELFNEGKTGTEEESFDEIMAEPEGDILIEDVAVFEYENLARVSIEQEDSEVTMSETEGISEDDSVAEETSSQEEEDRVATTETVSEDVEDKVVTEEATSRDVEDEVAAEETVSQEADNDFVILQEVDLSPSDFFEFDENHHYVIKETAPLGGQISINVAVVHTLEDGTDVTDVNLAQTIRIESRSYKVTFMSNGGTVRTLEGNAITSNTYSEEEDFLSQISVERTGYLFEGWFTDEACTNPFEGVMPMSDLVLYAKWKAHSYSLLFDANGGQCVENSRLVLCDQPVGTLPVPTRDYFTFKGWYTAADGGTLVSEDTYYTSADDRTLYAHWEANPVSGWVKASELPANAQVVNRKWTYTRTTYAESTNTSMAGYQQYDSYWVQSGSGNFKYSTEFPSGFDTGHSIYSNYAKAPVTAYENTTNKRVVSTWHEGYIYYHWMYNVAYANVTNRAISAYRGTYNNWAYIYFYAFASTADCPYLSKDYCNNQNLPSYNCRSVLPETSSIGIGTNRFFRFPYRVCSYTDYYKVFKYKKIENNLEATTNVSGTANVSNVVEWVQYQAK